METIEDMVIFYREKYQETVQEMNKMSFWNKEKVRYEGFIEEKDFLIAKLQETV